MDTAKLTKMVLACTLAGLVWLPLSADGRIPPISFPSRPVVRVRTVRRPPAKTTVRRKAMPAWVVVAASLTPIQKKAVAWRLEEKDYHESAPVREAWSAWQSNGQINSDKYAPQVHAILLKVCEEVRQTKVISCFQWNPPDLERRWEQRLAGADSLSTSPRTKGADSDRGELLLEKFAASRMPASFARYRGAREVAEELERIFREYFPQGLDSDPTGGESYERICHKLRIAIAEMFRRHDELCFFLLMRKAGVFSDAALKKFDDQGGAVWLESDLLNMKKVDFGELPVLSEEDVRFAQEYLSACWEAVQALIPLCDEGITTYRELRRLAFVLDAVRAESLLALFRNRAATIQTALVEAYRQIGIIRFQYQIGELNDADLVARNRQISATLLSLAEEVRPARWVSQKAKMGVLNLPGGQTMDMVWCPPGTFKMGSPATEAGRGMNEEQRNVTIAKGFWMAKYELTRQQWASVMGERAPSPQEAKLPKTCETKCDISVFCDKTMLSLPTEEEWEYACRAGNMGAYGGSGRLDEMGWHVGNSGGAVHPVGEKCPNAWGLYDMHGNAWERCEGKGAPIRGGSVHDRGENCRSAFSDSLERRVQNKAEKDVGTMFRRLREEGIDEIDLQRGFEWLPSGKREKLRKLYEEGVIVDPMSMGKAILQNIGFRLVFRAE